MSTPEPPPKTKNEILAFISKNTNNFVHDGCSAPILRNLYEKSHLSACLIHDYLYRSDNKLQWSRKAADDAMYEFMLQDGVARTDAWIAFVFVRAAGGFYFQKKKIEKQSPYIL